MFSNARFSKYCTDLDRKTSGTDRGNRAPSVLAQGLKTPITGPSDHTKDELKALKVFTETKSTSLPHLIAWKTAVQGPDGPMPGGYIAYIVMTLMPGQHLMDLKFWSMADEEREEIRKAFIPVLKYALQCCVLNYACRSKL
jgi:hypothetical protein